MVANKVANFVDVVLVGGGLNVVAGQENGVAGQEEVVNGQDDADAMCWKSKILVRSVKYFTTR